MHGKVRRILKDALADIHDLPSIPEDTTDSIDELSEQENESQLSLAGWIIQIGETMDIVTAFLGGSGGIELNEWRPL